MIAGTFIEVMLLVIVALAGVSICMAALICIAVDIQRAVARRRQRIQDEHVVRWSRRD